MGVQGNKIRMKSVEELEESSFQRQDMGVESV